ncbi:MAG: lysophospholipid acyltransferase family protein [Deltaproteobacteria bacterium]|nr:lysophospholipid acyltransferase family protein [Deltaproteobacteria bacterium]
MMYRIPSVTGLGLSQFFQLSFNVKLARLLPFICLRIYLYLLGFIYFSLKRTDRKRIILCLNYVLKLNLKKHTSCLDSIKTFLGIFDHYFEKLIMAHRPLSKMIAFLRLHLHIKNRDYLDRVTKTGKGCILVTGHFGAVEFLPLSLAINGYKVVMICRFKTKRLKDELMKRAREVDVILIDANEPKVAFRALRAIKSGRILITECDEFSEWRPHPDKRISVFGHTVPQDRTLDFLYRRAKVPVLMGLMRREKRGFMLCIDSLADGGKDESLAARTWNKLEDYILNYPQQWYQWKDASIALSEHIVQDNKKDTQEVPLIPSERPVLSADLS